MEYSSIVSALDAELARLHEVRRLLAQAGKIPDVSVRAKGKKATKVSSTRKMSAEGRARIAEAQRKRWAAQKKAAKKAA